VNEFAAVVGPGTIRLERLMPGPVGRVWAYLTDPALRATWLAGGPIELRVGGLVDLVYDHALISSEDVPERFRDFVRGMRQTGRVTRCEPPVLLAFSWGEGPAASEVSFELVAEGTDTRLILTHQRLTSDSDIIDAAGGWHAHVDILEDRVSGGAVRPFWAGHERLEADYQRLLAPQLALGAEGLGQARPA
jgi:uncharacterized protein YndB with AHSA1/START domain